MINDTIMAGLVLAGLYFVVMNLKTFIMPQKTGRVVAFGQCDNSEEDNVLGEYKNCNSCHISKNAGNLAFPIKIRLDDDTIVDAEISPCSLCIDGVKIGDRVGVTQTGSRSIVQKIGKFCFTWPWNSK